MQKWLTATGAALAGLGHFLVATGATGSPAVYLWISGVLMVLLAAAALPAGRAPWRRVSVALFALVAATSVWRLAAFPWGAGVSLLEVVLPFLLHHVGILAMAAALAAALVRHGQGVVLAARIGAALAGVGAIWSALASPGLLGALVEGAGFLLLAGWPFGTSADTA